MKRISLSWIALLLVICTLISCGGSTPPADDNQQNDQNSQTQKPDNNDPDDEPDDPDNNNGPDDTDNKPQTETPAEFFEFTAGDDGYTVTKYTGSHTVVVIPSVYENKKVTNLDKTVFSGNITLEAITLSKHMTKIDLVDFNGCDALTTITYPGEVTEAVSYAGPANLTTLALPGVTKITYDHHISSIIQDNKKLETLDLSGMESLYVNTFDESCYEGMNVIVSDALYQRLSNLPATYHRVNIYRDKDEYSLSEFSFHDEFFNPEIPTSGMVNIEWFYEYFEFETNGNTALISALQKTALEELTNYYTHKNGYVKLFDTDKLLAALSSGTVKYYYCYNPKRGEMPDEVLYKNTDNADMEQMYDEYGVYGDSFLFRDNMAAVYASFTYEGKHYEFALTFRYGVSDMYDWDTDESYYGWHAEPGENNYDNFVMNCESITAIDCRFTTFFGNVSTITVNGKTFSYTY